VGRRSAEGDARYAGTITFDAVHVPEYGSDNDFDFPVCCAAPTAEEILRRLPDFITVAKVNAHNRGTIYRISFDQIEEEFKDASLSNAAAAMYCYLSKNGLLPKA
jgi:hypothetical protein